MSELSFTVDGDPLPQPKPRTTGKARFYPARYTTYREEVVDHAQAAALELEQRGEPWDAHQKRYTVRARFIRRTRQRCDLDRLVATLFDACTRAGLWQDDMLVDRLRAERDVDPENPRVEVTIEVTP